MPSRYNTASKRQCVPWREESNIIADYPSQTRVKSGLQNEAGINPSFKFGNSEFSDKT